MPRCSFGEHLNDACAGESQDYLHPEGDELWCLRVRSGCNNAVSICEGQYLRFGKLYTKNQRRCCDPLRLHTGKVHAKDLRVITCQKAKEYQNLGLIPGQKLCRSCRISVDSSRAPDTADPEVEPSLPSAESSSSSTEDEPSTSQTCTSETPVQELAAAASFSPVNEALQVIGISPIVRKKLRQKKYPQQKLRTIGTRLKSQLGIEESAPSTDSQEILLQMKEKFATATNSERLQILTLVPRSWSIRKTMQEFETTDWMVRKAKQLGITLFYF